MQPCLIQFRIVSVKIITHFLPLNTNKSFQTVCFGPFISPWVHKDHIFYITSKFFQRKRFALKPWGQGVWRSRLMEPATASVSKECFACFLLLAQKALWHSSNLWFFCVFSLIIYCQLEYLLGATMECISKAVIL